MPNRLANETSPYLLQHADNPVDWYPWGEEAFAKAKEENKPIFLSIGYSACHWCHVMERESFASPETASVMNKNFVNIKVDREERPDVDSIYMEAVVAITGSGGWPLTVFLKPDGEPFFGGTYFPPAPREGMRGFRELLSTIRGVWDEKQEEVDRSSSSLMAHLRTGAEAKPPEDAGELAEGMLYGALENLMATFDWEWGGWGQAPKFPPAPALEFLLRRGTVDLVETTLDKMALGGMYDLVGGGFHRYSTDQRWLVPHFEKMLYDNALLAVSYLHGWQVLGKERYREVVEETVGYMLRELALEGGGFASAQDADTNGVEGETFTWKRDGEVPDQLLNIFEGGRFIIRGELDEELRAHLLELRNERDQPALDDKAIASWNGLTLAALAECGRVLGRDDWLEAARALAEFLLGPMSSDGRLHRTWRDGVAKGTGYLEDYADVANGLYELHVATGELRWLEESYRLALLAVDLFGDADNGGFFHTPADGETLVLRKKDFDDHPAPSGNSMLAYVLIRLARVYGDDELAEKAASYFKLVPYALMRVPSSFGWGLVALDLYLSPRREVAVVGQLDSEVARAALTRWDPKAVVAVGPSEAVPLLEGKTLVDGQTAVYVCERFACQAPVTDAAALPPVPAPV